LPAKDNATRGTCSCGLDENERPVLATATVIGRSFTFQLLTGIGQIDIDELFTVVERAQPMGYDGRSIL
jgi:hypothetical protein